MYIVKLTHHKTELEVNESCEGEPLEDKLERILNNQEGIDAESPLIYNERGEGTPWETDIRTDKHEMMILAQDKIQRENITRDVNIAKEQREAAAKKDSEETDKNTGGNQET